MKELLAKPGRDGQWSGFLRERNIPRATGDRLVARHQRSLNPDANRLSEPVSEPTEEEVQIGWDAVAQPRSSIAVSADGAVFERKTCKVRVLSSSWHD
jgi:hypothetical protein